MGGMNHVNGVDHYLGTPKHSQLGMFSQTTCATSMDDTMDSAHQSRITSDDLMSGFNVPDENREYLADLVNHRIGPEEDIQTLIEIALYTGVEEWEHAFARAEALRKRAGEGDILEYLASVYGIDGALEHSCERRKTESERKSPRPEVQRKRVKRKISSSYWDDARCPQSDELTHLRKESDPSRKISQKDGQKEFEAQQKEYEGEQKESEDEQKEYNLLKESRPNSPGPRTNAQKLSDDVLQEENGAHGGNLDASFGPGGSDNRDQRDNNQDLERGQEEELEGTEREEGEETSSPHKAISALKPNPNKEPRQSRTRISKSHYFETFTSISSTLSTTVSTTLTSQTKPNPGTKTTTNATTPKRPLSPFPPLTASQFGLIQEELIRDPFALLIAVTLLIRTSGRAAIPVFRALISAYPTPAAFAGADRGDLEGRIKHLGLGVVRAATMQRYARIWLEREPEVGVRFRVKGYPGEWEVGHVTGGAYAVDSWRIFCRDLLLYPTIPADREGQNGHIGEGHKEQGGDQEGEEGEREPEWMRVLPQDKELRAYLRWMWMREGWWWDPVTGERQVLGREVRRMVMEGRVGYDNRGELWVRGEGRRLEEFCED